MFHMKTKKSTGNYTCLKKYLYQENDHCFVVLFTQSNVRNVWFTHALRSQQPNYFLRPRRSTVTIAYVFSLLPAITCTVSHCVGTDTSSCLKIPECIIGSANTSQWLKGFRTGNNITCVSRLHFTLYTEWKLTSRRHEIFGLTMC